MKAAMTLGLLAFALTASALAKDAKLTTQSKSIDQGMNEAGKKADIARSQSSKAPKAKISTPQDRTKENN
jgi:hypothetical protein